MEAQNSNQPESDPLAPAPNATSGADPAAATAPDGSQPIAAPAPAPQAVTQENTATATAPAAAPAVTQPPAPPADAAPAPTQQQPVDDLFADDEDDDVAPSASPGKLFDDDDEDMAEAEEEEEEEEYEDEGDAEDDEDDEEDSQAEDDEALARRLQREWEEEDNRPRRNRRARRYDSSESPSPPRKRRVPPKKERSSRRAAAQKSYVEVGSSAEDESDIDLSDGSPRIKGDTYGTKKGRRSPPPTDSKEGIERLLCQETLTKKEWRPILEKMRTKHVFHGSAMDVPDGGEALPEDEDLPITRFLVKWKQFSFLHVSWETKRDLESIDQKACQRAIMSLQGRERKGQVPEIGKPPCAKRAFDPQMVEVVCGRRPLSVVAPSTRHDLCHLASRRRRGGVA